MKLIRGTNPKWAEETDTFEWLSEVELSLNTVEINDDIWQSPFYDDVEKEFEYLTLTKNPIVNKDTGTDWVLGGEIALSDT